eukprot:4301075-Pyramimonas_sp.AAC.1
MRSLAKKGKHEWRGILRAMAAGSSLPRAGLQRCGLAQNGSCKRCGELVGCRVRRAWSCPKNAEFSKVSDFVARRALAAWG